MSGFEDLRNLGVQFGTFDGPVPPSAGQWSRFDSPWYATVDLLGRELRMLDAKAIVVEVDFSPGDFRLDVLPRSNARANSPAVRVTFTSKWGPLRYETSEYLDWRDNIRAIALSMEALRKVDRRYGVSKRGEQYRGWRQLTSGSTPEDSIVTREQALAVLHHAAGVEPGHEDSIESLVRRAVRRTHPDVGGSEEEFRKVTKAREVLST